MKIKKLPAETRSKLQSGIVITDAVQCVLELVHNSLDAEATGIAVRIDLKSYKIRVIDNGRGIGRDDLELVGERFMTSKYKSVFEDEKSISVYGFKGQALSNLREVSRSLIIETKSKNGGPTFMKVFQNNKALPITEVNCKKQGTGTTVTLEDFMYTMPVRRKRINEVFDMEEIKTQLQQLAVIHYNVCFTLKNENKNLILLQTPQASTILESLKNIYGKGLVKSLKNLYYKEKKYEITGYISLKPQIQDNVQLLYLNKRIITRGIIHKFINKLIKEWSGKTALLLDSPIDQIIKSVKVSPQTAFIILIHCPHSNYELFTNLRKTSVEFKDWKVLLKCLHKAIKRIFESFTNLDHLSNSHNGVEFKAVEDKKNRRAIGTSLLLNAVKGAPAKRCYNVSKDVIKRKKMKINESKERFEVSLHKNDYRVTENSFIDSLNIITQQKEYTFNDSLESPIPKKNSKLLRDSKHIETIRTNQSFLEFSKWVKARLKTDTNAFNLYNDFLHFKSSGNEAKEVTNFKSPVLGGKPKPRKAVKSKRKDKAEDKKLSENKKKPHNDFCAVDGKMAILNKMPENISHNVHVNVQKAVQDSKLKSNVPKNVNVALVTNDNFNFEKFNVQSVFKQPESINVLNKNQKQVECSSSLTSSEMQFTNIIKFRNFPESCFFQPSDSNCKMSVEKSLGCSISNSWASHYQDFMSENIEFFEGGRNKKHCFSWPETPYELIPKRNKNLDFDFYNFFEASLIELTNKTKAGQKLQNAEIQVDLTDIPVQKVNATVQTHKVSESLSFENSYKFQQNLRGETEYGLPEDQNKCLENTLGQEVPNPDFWNTTAHMELEKNNGGEVISDVNDAAPENLIKGTQYLSTGKNSESSDFICGHKSNSSTFPQNEGGISKETQTLVIWTDSLTKLDYATENMNITAEINFNSRKSKTENTNDVMSKETVPIQQTQEAISQPDLFKFCLTERHDFVPKGLSPKFLYPEIGKTFILSPNGRCKLKLAIDDTQNELLLNVKWQDDCTGNSLKPSIPDKIFSEMRRKVGEKAVSCENSVLSASMSYYAVKVHNLLHSFAFTKELLSGVEILGQLDKKFIVTKIKIPGPKKMELISLFDQHAVDERIKLEGLINENLSVDGKLVSSHLNPPVECFLTESDVRIASDLQEKMLNYGLRVKPINENKIFVYEIPTFLLKKHEKDFKSKKETALVDAIKALIINIVGETIETRGSVSKIPKIIHDAFCLEACHKAIKFNKSLTVENMCEMIQKLQSCKLPFQCAHGRPSVIPIIDLEDFNSSMNENKSINFQDLKHFLDKRNDIILANENA